MLIDPNTGQKISSSINYGTLHQYLMLDNGGTGLFNAHLQPNDLGEHEHSPYQISIVFDDARLFSTWQTATGKRHKAQVRTGQCYIVPSSQPHGLVIERPSELMNFYLTPDWIAEAIPEATGRSLDLGDLKITEDQFIQQLATVIRSDRLRHGQASKLLVESATNTLAFHLVNNYSHVAVKPAKFGVLPIPHLAKVRDFIPAEGTGDISIKDMAQIAGYES